MEKVHMTLDEQIEKKLHDEYKEALKDSNFVGLIKKVKIKEEDAIKNTSKLQDTCEEIKCCQNCKGLFMCKNKVNGHVLYPSMENDTLKFIYTPCKYFKALEQKKLEKEASLNEVANARMKDIDITDKNRIKVIKAIKEFYDNYEPVNTLKGIYLHGSFGSGKTFLLAALLNELRISKNALTEIVYFPELLRNMKEDFSLVEDKLNYLQNVDILLLDDIGAESVTEWGRDEILGTILQYRMNHKLTTFFTSNLTISELEKHLAISRGNVDNIKARRIIERIKQMTDDYEIISENKRK